MILAHEKVSKEEYSYFKKFREIADTLSVKQQDIDLLFIRETNQKLVKEIYNIKAKENCTTISDFGHEQLKIAQEVITYISPKVVVVANALASDLIRESSGIFNISNEINDDYGFHFMEIKHTLTPILFSSMITGQRALDDGSYERLVWHIKKALSFQSSSSSI